MPANRSRTDRWRQVLQQIHDRNGGLEFAVDQGDHDAHASVADLVWRVRITQITDDAIFVEPPAAVGRTMQLAAGTPVVCVMAVGQNRWMFKSRIVESGTQTSFKAGIPNELKIQMPTDVERCIRRNFYRVNAAEINLPKVQVYPLRDIGSAVPAEVANAELIKGLQRGGGAGEMPSEESFLRQLPDVGTPFTARLMNVGGGGVGLIIEKSDASALEQARVFWLRLDLQPHIPALVGLTARLAHTHIDSEQNTYAGLAFEFAHHPQHREFVVHQFTSYVDAVQAQLRLRKAA